MACLASVDVRRSLTLPALRRFWEQGFIGLAIYCQSSADAETIAAWPNRSIAFLNERRAILSFNATPEATRALTATLPRLDGCSCLLSHLGLPGQFRRKPGRAAVKRRLDALLALAPYSHIGVKLSGIYAISDPPHAYPHVAAQPFIHELAGAFGGKRLYWGSDYPPCLEYVSFVQAIHCIVDTQFPATTMGDIYGANLRRVVFAARRASSIIMGAG
jgi:predicted TIM-barrel fold metal-dependent hydrolase